ncbi:hypothetical protein SMD44_02342 [Streptomyces alboflavus]|uniref:Uncharacterized protein n=1 Tax=Streptomyces alboflavus TaxID=67267 RepID=A0A1Z1W938_9ACTN|nr:hypothetical protein SMD44_02342 [Streptomyces alboflavus]
MCLAVLAPAALAGCGRDDPADAAPADVRRLLDRRAEAVLERDPVAYRATGGPTAAYDRLRDVPLKSWTYRLKDFERDGARATATADLSYRVAGYDRAPLTAERTLSLQRRDGRWQITAERPAAKASEQLWDQGRVDAVRGTHSLILGVGRERAELRRYAELADRAVPAVRDAWRGDWPGKVVVLVPKSLDNMADLLGAPASGYQGIAAVTTGEAGGSGRTPADRIVVNPDAYGVLGELGKQVVLTHETTHVATRARTSRATPSGSPRASPTGSATAAPTAPPTRPPPNSAAPSSTDACPPPSPPTTPSASAATRRGSRGPTRGPGWPAG